MLGGKFQSGTSVQWCRPLTRHISIPRLTSTSPLYAPRPRDHTRRRGSGAGCPPLRWVLGDPVERFLARMGGGTAASFRCRRMRVITASWVIAAMIRSEPWRQNGQRLERVREFHDDSSRQDLSGVYHRSGLVLFSRVPWQNKIFSTQISLELLSSPTTETAVCTSR